MLAALPRSFSPLWRGALCLSFLALTPAAWAALPANAGTLAPVRISADGRVIAYSANASNLVPNDLNGQADVFIYDQAKNSTEVISVNPAGMPVGGLQPSISADGRYVAFRSAAPDLVAGDTNGQSDIFVRDRLTRTTVRVSLSNAGTESDAFSERPAISADGQFVAFESDASNLVAGDGNGVRDIFVRDLLGNITTRASVDSAGLEANGASFNASINGNGARVVFQSSATNLVPSDTNSFQDVFMREGASTVRISVNSAGSQAAGSSQQPSISADGRFISFESSAGNLVAGDTNGVYDIFLRDTFLLSTTRISVDSSGLEASGGDSFASQISPNGQFIAYQSDANNLVAGDTNAVTDTFFVDRTNGQVLRTSVNSAGMEASSASIAPAISDSGQWSAFASNASNLTPGDTNGFADLFLRDVGGGRTLMLSLSPDANSNLEALYQCEQSLTDSSPFARMLLPAFGTPQFDNDAYSGSSCLFDGATQLKSADGVFPSNTNVSFSFWLRDGSVTGQETIMQTVPGASVSNVINSIDMDGAQRLRIWGNNPTFPFSFSQSAPTPLNDDAWHHVVITAAGDNSSVKMYVDGIPQPVSVMGTPSAVDLSSTFYLGARSDLNSASAGNFLGRVDDVAIYSRVLHPLDIGKIEAKPGMSQIPNFSVDEDTVSAAIPFTVRDLSTPSNNLQVAVLASSDPSIIPVAGVTLGGAGMNRTVSVAPLPEQSGLVQITLRVSDDEGNSDTKNFLVSVDAVNDPPTISAISDITIAEDASSGAIAFTIGDVESSVNTLLIVAGSDNPVLIPGANIVLSGSGANRTVAITPEPDQFGSANFQVIVDDGQVSTIESFVVTVTPVNDAPTVTAISDITLNEDTASAPIAFTIGDIDNVVGTLSLVAGSDNPALFPTPNIAFGGSGANRTLTLTPATDQSGVANFQVIVDDGQSSTVENFVVTVNPVNDAPTLSPISDIAIDEDTPSAPIAFTIDDVDTAIGSVSLIAGSDNPTLFPTPNIAFGGSGANRTLTLTPAADESGTANFQVIVDDGQFSTVETFTVTVNAINDVPTVSAIGNVTFNEDTISAPIAFTVGDVETLPGLLLVSASTDNPSLLPASGINLATTGANFTLTLEPAANQFGSASVTISVSDGTDSTTTTFLVSVSPINDAPTLTSISDINIAEDSTSSPITFTIDDVDSPLATLIVIAGSDNPTLFPTAGVVLGGSGANRTLTLTPAANLFGTANFQVIVDDGQFSASRNFAVTVTSLNDLPSFTIGTNQVVAPATASAQSVPNWASNIDDGDPQIQSLNFNVSVNATPGMFSVAPSVSANGTLSYTPSGLPGMATLSVSLSDDNSAGSPALTSAIQTATIVVQGTVQLTVQATPNSVVFGQPYSVRISVHNAANALVPSGQVRLRPLPAGAPVACLLAPVAAAGTAEATCNVPSPASATDKLLQADYLGDAVFVVGRGFGVVNVAPAATQISVLSDTPDPSSSNSPVTVRYQVQVLSPSLAPLSSLRGTIVARAGSVEVRAPYSSSNPEIVITPQGNGSVPITLSYVDDTNFENSAVVEDHTLAGGGTTDLAVLVSNSQNFVTGGGRAMYVIRIDNLGTVSSSAQLDAALPTGLSNASWTCSASAGSQCQLPSGSGGIVAVNTVAAGGFVNYLVNSDVSAPEGSLLSYQARITPAATPPDSNAMNNESTDRDVVVLYLNGFE